MWKTQKKFEEKVTVVNENSPIRGDGGIAIITDNTSTGVKMVMLPDGQVYHENRKEGQFSYERVYAHVSKNEMDKTPIVPGRTKVIWNGLTYVVMEIIDYSNKLLFKNAEIELRRKLDHI